MSYTTLNAEFVNMLKKYIAWPDTAMRECYLFSEVRGIVEGGQVTSMASWSDPPTGIVIFHTAGPSINYVKFKLHEITKIGPISLALFGLNVGA
jgi:hypothetical protein